MTDESGGFYSAIDAETDAMLHNLMHSLEPQGIDLANYLQITGQDPEEFLADTRERADQALRTRILLDAVAASEDVEVDDSELEDAITALAIQAEQSEDEVRSALEDSGQVQALTGDILRRKALDLVLSEASPVDADGNPVDLTPPTADEDTDEETEDDGDDAGTEAGEED